MADASGLQAYGFEKKGLILHKEICALTEHVEERLDRDEHVSVVARAFLKDRWRKKQFVLLVLTQRRLVAFDGKTGNLLEEVPSGSGVRYTFTPEKYGNRLDASVAGASSSFSGVTPQREALRIMRLASGQFGQQDDRTLLPAHFPAEPDHPLASVVHDAKLNTWAGAIYLYRDRLVSGDVGDHLPFDEGPVRATVDTAGNIAATRGRNLAAKAAATAVTGPVGLLLAGNASVKTIDTRLLWLLVEAPRWTFTRPYSPEREAAVARFAQKVNSVAAKSPSLAGRDGLSTHAATVGPASHGEAPSTREDPATQLHTLARLRDEGIVTDAEYERERLRILREI